MYPNTVPNLPSKKRPNVTFIIIPTATLDDRTQKKYDMPTNNKLFAKIIGITMIALGIIFST